MTPAGDADVGKGARAASGSVAIRAEDSLSALSALLGEDEVEARRRREMDEADARRAEAQAEGEEGKRGADESTARVRQVGRGDVARAEVTGGVSGCAAGDDGFFNHEGRHARGRDLGDEPSGSSFRRRCSTR